MVARAAGAAGPVLVACHDWDSPGLARRLRGAVCDYCVGGCRALLGFARHLRQIGRAVPGPLLVSLPPCRSSLASVLVRDAGCPSRVSLFVLGMAVPSPRLHKSAQLRGSSEDGGYLQQYRKELQA